MQTNPEMRYTRKHGNKRSWFSNSWRCKVQESLTCKARSYRSQSAKVSNSGTRDVGTVASMRSLGDPLAPGHLVLIFFWRSSSKVSENSNTIEMSRAIRHSPVASSTKRRRCCEKMHVLTSEEDLESPSCVPSSSWFSWSFTRSCSAKVCESNVRTLQEPAT